jgi:hypothetical protein
MLRRVGDPVKRELGCVEDGSGEKGKRKEGLGRLQKRRRGWSGLEVVKEEDGYWVGLRKRPKRPGGKRKSFSNVNTIYKLQAILISNQN